MANRKEIEKLRVLYKNKTNDELTILMHEWVPHSDKHIAAKLELESRTPRNDTSGQERTTGETGKTVKEGEQPYEISDEFLNWHCDRIDDVPRKCLVIMAFGDKETIEYKNNMAVFLKIIKPCVENSGYNFTCYHADLIDKSGNISRQIIEGLRDDDLVIADLRRNNINMVYELGVRHALGKRTILVCSDFSENFFHSRTYRAIRYNIQGASNQEFYDRLKQQIKEVVENPYTSDNPVIDMIGREHLASFQETASNNKLTFDDKLNVYVDSNKGRYCPGCYNNEGKTIRVIQSNNIKYKCPVCSNEYIDQYKQDAHHAKLRQMQEEHNQKIRNFRRR